MHAVNMSNCIHESFFLFIERSMNKRVNILYWMHVIRINAPQRCACQLEKIKYQQQKNKVLLTMRRSA